MKFDLEFARKAASTLAGLRACIVLACTPIVALAHPVLSSSMAAQITSSSRSSGLGERSENWEQKEQEEKGQKQSQKRAQAQKSESENTLSNTASTLNTNNNNLQADDPGNSDGIGGQQGAN
jgi:hypothetical protein